MPFGRVAMHLEWFLFEFAGLILIKATALLILGCGLVWLLRHHSAGARYSVWSTLIVLLALLIPLVLIAPGFQLTLIHPPGYSELKPVSEMDFAGSGVAAERVVDLLGIDAADTNRDLSGWELAWSGLLLIWIAGAVVLAAKLLTDLLGLLLMSRSGKQAPQAWSAMIEEIRVQAGFGRTVKVRVCGTIGSPLIWGLRHPTILLPSSAIEWSEDRLHTVLLHEMLHASRNDHVMVLLAQLVRCLFWVNPLTWYCVYRHGVERELSCDERVIGAGKDRIDYAQELVEITRDLRREVRYASVAMTQQQGLKSRVRSLLEDNRLRAMSAGAARMIFAAGLVATAAVAGARIVAPPEEDSFEAAVRTLFGRDVQKADEAAYKLGKMGDPRAVPYLMKVAGKYVVPHTRMQAMIALGRIGEEKGLKLLREELIGDPDYGIRYTAVKVLEDHPSEATTKVLVKTSEADAEPSVRLRAYKALVYQEWTTDVEPIRSALADPEPEIRMIGLGLYGDLCRDGKGKFEKPCEDTIAKLLDDTDSNVREVAVESLADLDSKSAIKVLERAAKESKTDVRQLARAALEKLSE